MNRSRLHGVVRSVCGAMIALASGLITSAAFAYEGQATLDVDGGYSQLLIPSSLPGAGVAGGISGSLGFDDTWAVRARLGYAFHPDSKPLHFVTATAELLYVVDVFEFVPTVGLGLDWLGTFRDGQQGNDFAAHAVFGLDYLLSREVAVGVDVRPYVLVTSLSTTPIYLTATLRLSWLFDLGW